MSPRRNTFVTVAHEVDFALMRLQANSFARFCPRELVDQIIVVENFNAGVDLDWRPPLLRCYGYLADRVVFHRGQDIAPKAGASGWWTQQVLKLLAAKLVSGDRYTVLDAKNHLVFPLECAFLEAPDGRARIRRYGYGTHPLRGALERTLRYLDIDPAPHVGLFTQTATPFTIYREHAVELIDYVERREGRQFKDAFLNRQLTEFFLYSGWLVKAGCPPEVAYDCTQPDSRIVWPHQTAPLELLQAVGEVEESRRPFFAIHRGAVAKLDDVGREIVAQFWARRGLFGTIRSAAGFLADEVQA